MTAREAKRRAISIVAGMCHYFEAEVAMPNTTAEDRAMVQNAMFKLADELRRRAGDETIRTNSED
jgi:hypothetical protein